MKAQDDGLGVRADVEMMHPAGELLRRMNENAEERSTTVVNRAHSPGWGERSETENETIVNRRHSPCWGERIETLANKGHSPSWGENEQIGSCWLGSKRRRGPSDGKQEE